MTTGEPLVTTLRLSATVFSVLTLAACSPATRAVPEPPPAYPWSGFGRLGCYAGASLGRLVAGSRGPDDSAAIRGPWLVLDSLTAAEIRRGGVTRRLTPEDLRPATLVERRDTLERTGGYWYRVPPDSILFEEASTFPAVTWRLRLGAADLRGEGVLTHNVVTREPDGRHRRRVSRWPVYAVRVPCAAVPVRQSR